MDIPTTSIIVNIIMSVATACMAIATMQSVKEMNLSRKETNRSYLVAYFRIITSEAYLIIKNFGGTAAHNISIEPVEGEDYSNVFTPIFSRTIDIIAPSSQINIHLKDDNYENELPKLSLNLIYYDIYNEKHVEKYDLDVNYIEDENISQNPVTPFLNLINNEHDEKLEKINPKNILITKAEKLKKLNEK